MRLSIITPEKTLYHNEDVKRVTLNTVEGEITVLPGHIPLVTFLAPGEIVIEDIYNNIKPLAVSGGFIEVNKETVKILADTAERVEELDVDRAEEAKIRAEELLRQKHTASEEFAYLSAKIEKELARIKVGKKYRHLRLPRN